MKGDCVGSRIGRCAARHYVVLQCSLDILYLLQQGEPRTNKSELTLLVYEYNQYPPLLQ